jgi:hypothetical protein
LFLVTTTDPKRQPLPGKVALDDVMNELAELIPLTAVSKKSGLSLPRRHRARLKGDIACTKILGKWCTTATAIREMINRASSTASPIAAKQQSGTRTESERKAAADRALAEIQSLTA